MWGNYRTTFPERYIQQGYFDEYIRKVALELNPKTILDVGGGSEGTEVLRELGIPVYLLDPYIPEKPWWMTGMVEWDTIERFDMIVARGSINYLARDELSKLSEFLDSRGVFVANTFLEHPPEKWVEREYRSISGQKGLERFRYNPKKKIIEHELIPESGDKITHSFFYYSPADYKKIFPNSRLIKYKDNSAILYFDKK